MMFRVIVVVFLFLQHSQCQRMNLTSSTVEDFVRVGASFVSRFLSSKSTTFLPSTLGKYLEGSKVFKGDDFIPIFLRLFGVDSERVQNWALRGFLSILPLMNQFLTEKEVKNRKRRSPEGFSIFRYILQRPQVENLLSHMQNPNLVDELLKESEKLTNADCVKLLMCKTKPIVRGMQKSLRFFLSQEKMEPCDETCSKLEGEWKRASLEDRMYFFLPGLSEMVTAGDECDEEYPDCGY